MGGKGWGGHLDCGFVWGCIPVKASSIEILVGLQVHPGSGTNFRSLSKETFLHLISNNGHISRFCFVFQVTQVILLGKFWPAEEVFLSFILITKPPLTKPPDFKFYFLEKRPWKRFSTNALIHESNPQTQSNISWISSKAEHEILFIKTLLWKNLLESGPKICPATGVDQLSPFFQKKHYNSRSLLAKGPYTYFVSVCEISKYLCIQKVGSHKKFERKFWLLHIFFVQITSQYDHTCLTLWHIHTCLTVWWRTCLTHIDRSKCPTLIYVSHYDTYTHVSHYDDNCLTLWHIHQITHVAQYDHTYLTLWQIHTCQHSWSSCLTLWHIHQSTHVSLYDHKCLTLRHIHKLTHVAHGDFWHTYRSLLAYLQVSFLA